ncbi:pyruvoyl-dependent arginine decarboxylase [Methanocaldococcus indicus]|uniref:pyruvoyl-dependent arginine decarboxylase n=1 Tax=Methanocaldococcus indicus TaxID=213231 RepID=UPI003C6CC637
MEKIDIFVRIPNTISLVAGKGEGETELNAFDRALLDAGVGNVNLVKMSSIMPPKAELVEIPKLPMGALVPIAYGCITSKEPGELIAAAVSVAFPKDEEKCGLIMEFSGKCSKKEAEERVREMAKIGFEMRGWDIKKIESIAIEHEVEKIGCAFAGAVLWYKEVIR